MSHSPTGDTVTHNEIVIPPPGSLAAIKQGCLCPSLDNGGGAGRLVIDPDGTEHRLYWISEDCLLHGRPTPLTGEGS